MFYLGKRGCVCQHRGGVGVNLDHEEIPGNRGWVDVSMGLKFLCALLSVVCMGCWFKKFCKGTMWGSSFYVVKVLWSTFSGVWVKEGYFSIMIFIVIHFP